MVFALVAAFMIGVGYGASVAVYTYQRNQQQEAQHNAYIALNLFDALPEDGYWIATEDGELYYAVPEHEDSADCGVSDVWRDYVDGMNFEGGE